MADQLDEAAEITENFTNDAIKDVRSLVPEPKDELTEDDLICDSCGSEIPEGRARLGHSTCLSCKEYEEKFHKRVTKMRRNSEWD